MNLRQAYDGWSQVDQNRQFYVNTRDAFRMAWFKLPTNKPCSWYTKDVLALALADASAAWDDKVKSASVMVHVLTWAHSAEPERNPEPDFETKDVTRLLHLPADKLEKERERITAAMRCLPELEPKADGSKGSVKSADPCGGCNNVKGCITCTDGDQRALITEAETRETNMSNEKNTGGRPAKQVVQIDPTTLKVVKVWPSMSEAERETGATNISRAMERGKLSGGFYWSAPEDADGFVPNSRSHLPRKYQQTEAPATAPKFKAGDHVRAKQPKELAGRTGYVAAVDTSTMMYEVRYGAELWIVRECDLEVAAEEYAGDALSMLSPAHRHGQSASVLSAAAKALEVFSDDELIAELERRGWHGEFSRLQVIRIGSIQ